MVVQGHLDAQDDGTKESNEAGPIAEHCTFALLKQLWGRSSNSEFSSFQFNLMYCRGEDMLFRAPRFRIERSGHDTKIRTVLGSVEIVMKWLVVHRNIQFAQMNE